MRCGRGPTATAVSYTHLLSGKNGISAGEAADGRYFFEFTEQLAEKILTVNDRMKLEQLWYTEDINGRKGFRWMNMIFRLSSKI